MIRTKPARKIATPNKEAKAKKFIKGAESKNGTASESELQPVMIKIHKTILAVIDAKASALGLTRTAYLITSATMKADELESESAQAKFIVAAHKAKANGKE